MEYIDLKESLLSRKYKNKTTWKAMYHILEEYVVDNIKGQLWKWDYESEDRKYWEDLGYEVKHSTNGENVLRIKPKFKDLKDNIENNEGMDIAYEFNLDRDEIEWNEITKLILENWDYFDEIY